MRNIIARMAETPVAIATQPVVAVEKLLVVMVISFVTVYGTGRWAGVDSVWE
jgi:hypothetical protein